MIQVQTEPSLALIKYWGKMDTGVNIPATGSIAVSLSGLNTITEVESHPAHAGSSREDSFILNGMDQQDPKIAAFLSLARRRYPHLRELRFTVRTRNTFPTAAGIASSSSGFAALAIALNSAGELGLCPSDISALARTGSGSAARAVFGGFTILPAGAEHAAQLYPDTHWPELRIVVVMVSNAAKPVGSRTAMEHTRETSPFYPAWLQLSALLEQDTLQAVANRSITGLGPVMRRSYLAMFGSMLAASPGILYWLPDSIAILQRATAWREQGLEVWETMDAGPQVKLITTDTHLPQLLDRLQQEFPHLDFITSSIGSGPTVREHPQ